jgi:hypothetical protein
MKETGLRRPRELCRERACLLRCDVETKRFDRHQAIALRLVRSKDGTESADTDLMQDPKRSERGRWGERGRVVSGQLKNSSVRRVGKM